VQHTGHHAHNDHGYQHITGETGNCPHCDRPEPGPDLHPDHQPRDHQADRNDVLAKYAMSDELKAVLQPHKTAGVRRLHDGNEVAV